MAGKTRPVLLKQILDKLDEIEHMDNPQLSKTKRDCIRELVNEKLNEKNVVVEKDKEIERLNNMLHDSFQGHLLNELQRKDEEIKSLKKQVERLTSNYDVCPEPCSLVRYYIDKYGVPPKDQYIL